MIHFFNLQRTYRSIWEFFENASYVAKLFFKATICKFLKVVPSRIMRLRLSVIYSHNSFPIPRRYIKVIDLWIFICPRQLRRVYCRWRMVQVFRCRIPLSALLLFIFFSNSAGQLSMYYSILYITIWCQFLHRNINSMLILRRIL